MISPLEMQVAFSAIPDFTRQATAEQAGAAYRQMQDMGKALRENLARQERVSETLSRTGVVFHPVEPKYEESRMMRQARHHEEKERRGEDEEERIYAPEGLEPFRHARLEEVAGAYLDLIA